VPSLARIFQGNMATGVASCRRRTGARHIGELRVVTRQDGAVDANERRDDDVVGELDRSCRRSEGAERLCALPC